MRKILYLAMLSLISGCSTMEGVTSFTSASDTGNLHENERRLWHEAAEFDDTIARSDQVYKNSKVTAYLQKTMDKLYPEFKGKIHVHLNNSTELNAFALPNGSIYFNIGLLSRIENEAQLAAVLGHEAVHFIEKHSLQERVSTKNLAAFSVSSVPFSRLASMSSISGFSQELELEADKMGYERLVKAGYNPHQAHKIFQHLADEVEALGIEEPYFFSSHPALVDRIDEFKRLSAKHKNAGKVGKKTYNKLMGSIRLDVLRNDIGRDRSKSVILVMEDSKKREYYPAAGYFYLGEAYSHRDEDGDAKKALKAYKKAEKMAPKFSPTYMRLGMHYMKEKNKSKAKYYFKRYLSLAPGSAGDRSYAKQYLKTL